MQLIPVRQIQVRSVLGRQIMLAGEPYHRLAQPNRLPPFDMDWKLPQRFKEFRDLVLADAFPAFGNCQAASDLEWPQGWYDGVGVWRAASTARLYGVASSASAKHQLSVIEASTTKGAIN